MPSTPNFGWPTLADDEQVANAPAVFRQFGDAVDATVAAGFRLVGVRTFTANGTFSKADPFGDGSFDGALMRAVRVRLVGGGGGGGGAAVTSVSECAVAGGGGGAAYAESFILASSLTSSVDVVVGAGGAAGAAGANAGSVGGSSFFGETESFEVFAEGGGGGGGGPARNVPHCNAPGAGGSGVTGQFTSRGSSGLGVTFSNVQDSINRPGGGASQLGQMGSSASISTGSSGLAEVGRRGAGGGGGVNTQNQSTARPGASGQSGLVIVEVFA